MVNGWAFFSSSTLFCRLYFCRPTTYCFDSLAWAGLGSMLCFLKNATNAVLAQSFVRAFRPIVYRWRKKSVQSSVVAATGSVPCLWFAQNASNCFWNVSYVRRVDAPRNESWMVCFVGVPSILYDNGALIGDFNETQSFVQSLCVHVTC